MPGCEGDQDLLYHAPEPLGIVLYRELRRQAEGRFFDSLAEAVVLLEGWRGECNGERIHSSLGYQTPEEFAGKTPPPTQTENQSPR